MAVDPPDVILEPHLAHVGMLEYYKAEIAVNEGSQCVRKSKAMIYKQLSMD